MTTNLPSLFQGCNPRVLAVFNKLVSQSEEEKRSRVLEHAVHLVKGGKKPERALADALSFYKLGGAVS